MRSWLRHIATIIVAIMASLFLTLRANADNPITVVNYGGFDFSISYSTASELGSLAWANELPWRCGATWQAAVCGGNGYGLDTARSFAEAVGSSLGTPNGEFGPRFVFNLLAHPTPGYVYPDYYHYSVASGAVRPFPATDTYQLQPDAAYAIVTSYSPPLPPSPPPLAVPEIDGGALPQAAFILLSIMLLIYKSRREATG